MKGHTFKLRLLLPVAFGIAALGFGSISARGFVSQDAAALQKTDAPPNGIWVDSLDLTNAQIRRPRAGGPGRAGQPASTPAPLVFALGGVTYPHAVPLLSDRDLVIGLNKQAVSFASMVGIDSSVAAGRGSVYFGVWVDGKKVADSGLMRGGDAPKLLTADLKGASRLVLAVIDGNDGTGNDNANWGGALITMASASSQRPMLIEPPAEPVLPIASSRSSVPLLNYPRITGATPGKPFMFQVPASGDEPLTFAAKNLPAGLTLNASTGLITGSLAAAGRTDVALTITNPKGRATGTLTIVGGSNALALTPPLGWNSWNAWGNTVTADRVRASADGMVKSGLHRQGYAYINIDDLWEGGERNNPASGRGPDGEMKTHANFPDMKGLVDHIHSLGLKAGIYSSPGPTTCQGYTASWEHEAQDAKTFAKWGFDYLKYDWCSYSRIAPQPTLEDRKKPYKMMADIIKTLDRDVVFSICQYGAGNVWEWGREVGGQLWRMTGDIRDNWPSMSGIGFQQTGREQYSGPGGWNDTDMLVVGQVGWSQGTRPTDLTKNEQLTHMALWALQAAPLLIGADLSVIDDWTTNILGNREMLAVNQDILGKAAGRRSSDGWVEVWSRPLEDGTIAVGLFNRGPEPATVTAKWAELGLSGSQPVRDIWLQKDLGRMTDQVSATVPRHGVLFVKIGAPKR